MTIDLVCYASAPTVDVQSRVNAMGAQHQGLFFERFLLWEVLDADQIHKEIALEYDFDANSTFSVSLNKKSAADLFSTVEAVIKNALDDKVLILLNNEIRR